jgi:hypothetical protein
MKKAEVLCRELLRLSVRKTEVLGKGIIRSLGRKQKSNVGNYFVCHHETNVLHKHIFSLYLKKTRAAVRTFLYFAGNLQGTRSLRVKKYTTF